MNLDVDNREVKIIHIYSPREDVYNEGTGELVDIRVQEGGYKRLVFNEGEDAYVDDIALYGGRRDGRSKRPLAYCLEGKVYLSETAEDVKFQVMS